MVNEDCVLGQQFLEVSNADSVHAHEHYIYMYYFISGYFCDDQYFAFSATTFTSQKLQYAEIVSSIVYY